MDQTSRSFLRHLGRELVRRSQCKEVMKLPERLSAAKCCVDAELRQTDRQLLPLCQIDSAHCDEVVMSGRGVE
jgi:hypothetical protein